MDSLQGKEMLSTRVLLTEGLYTGLARASRTSTGRELVQANEISRASRILICFELDFSPGSLHCASRRVRSEANAKKRRRLAPVGMTAVPTSCRDVAICDRGKSTHDDMFRRIGSSGVYSLQESGVSAFQV